MYILNRLVCEVLYDIYYMFSLSNKVHLYALVKNNNKARQDFLSLPSLLLFHVFLFSKINA